MDLNAELIRMLEARTHPRFVRAVLWFFGLGVICGGALLCLQLGKILFQVVSEGAQLVSAAIAGNDFDFQALADGLRSDFLSLLFLAFFALILGRTTRKLSILMPELLALKSEVKIGLDAYQDAVKEAREKGVDVAMIEAKIAQDIENRALARNAPSHRGTE